MHLCWLWCLGAAAGPGRTTSDAPSEARGADGERAGRRPQAQTRKQAREHKLHGRRAGSSRRGCRAGSSQRGGRKAGSSQRGGRKAGSSQRGLRDDTPSEAHGADAEQAGQANGPRRGRRAGGPSGQLTARTPSRRAAAPGHQHAEHAPTTRPGPAAPNSAEDPGLVKQSDQAVHHEGGECFERGLDLALGQRCERCDSVVGPGARKFARLIEHVVGAQAFHDRGEGLVGG